QPHAQETCGRRRVHLLRPLRYQQRRVGRTQGMPHGGVDVELDSRVPRRLVLEHVAGAVSARVVWAHLMEYRLIRIGPPERYNQGGSRIFRARGVADHFLLACAEAEVAQLTAQGGRPVAAADRNLEADRRRNELLVML